MIEENKMEDLSATNSESVHLKLTQQYGDQKDDETIADNKNETVTKIKILSYVDKTTRETIIATLEGIGWVALEHFSIHKFSKNLSTSIDSERLEVLKLLYTITRNN